MRSLTAVSLQTREHNFGVILFPHDERRVLGTSQVRLLLGVAMQIGLTLENYVVMNDAKRRTREYELLTQMGQVISSRLDSDEVLRSIHKELGLLFDTETFYVAFLEDDEVRFEFESVKGEVLPKRSRKTANAMTEYVIRSGQPMLVRSDMEKVRARLGLTFVPDIPAKSYCAVPIFINNHAVGVLAAMNFDREFVYEQRDLELLQTAAGQVAVAIENARLFKEQQRRSRYLAFLNNVSKTAISSQDAEQMLAEIASEIQQNFDFDHIGIGMLDYVTKEIEIKAEAGATASGAGKRVPLGAGIIGRCARSNEMVLVQNGDSKLASLLPDARSVLCLPLTYGESLLGVLNVESRREKAFADQEVLILRTLADLLATALHNAFVFQKLQQQSITDGLTGIKTRRFFLENLQTEWKRASRSGRPFSVALIDLDKFKEVNDTSGHLEGDLVLARVGHLLEQKCAAVQRGGALRRRRVRHPHARNRRRTGADSLRTPAPLDRHRPHAERAPNHRQLRRGQLSAARRHRGGSAAGCRRRHVRLQAGRRKLRLHRRGISRLRQRHGSAAVAHGVHRGLHAARTHRSGVGAGSHRDDQENVRLHGEPRVADGGVMRPEPRFGRA